MLALALSACQSFGGVRPRYGALPESELIIATDEPATLVRRLAAAAESLGLKVEHIAPDEGYLEMRWFDLSARRSVAPPFDRLGSTVKLRFFADMIQGKPRLLAECVQRVAWDPSVPPRELERMVPEGHPGRVLLDSLVAPFVADTTNRPPPMRP